MIKMQMEIEKIKGKYVIKFDAERFERMANILGFFNPEFLETLKKSLTDHKKGKVKNIKELYKKFK
jgi:hypothetical protein